MCDVAVPAIDNHVGGSPKHLETANGLKQAADAFYRVKKKGHGNPIVNPMSG